MFKIVYAISNSDSSKYQLKRFLEETVNKPFHIKIAAYKESSPKGINIDWTLNCLQNLYDPNIMSLQNKNYNILFNKLLKNETYMVYFDQIKSFNPDLIISDFEFFTSHIATLLNKRIWQCSPSILKHALPVNQKRKLDGIRYYSYFVNREAIKIDREKNMISNADRKLIYSYLGDANFNFLLNDGFEWIRPYHKIGDDSLLGRHNICANMIKRNKNIINLINRYTDVVAFTEFCDEYYPNIILKDINYYEEYIYNLRNCRLCINEGNTSFLADAFYNEKYSIIMHNLNDLECLINSYYAQSLGLGKIIYLPNVDLNQFIDKKINYKYNPDIKFLHEEIEKLL